MENTKSNLPKDVFLHLLDIITFYLTVIGSIQLYLQYISLLFPDQLNFFYSGLAGAVRTSSSILLIAFPVHMITAWLLGKDLKAMPEKREFKLRKWLTYLTLFVSAVTIIVDLIILVNHFLSGELTVRFLLKVLVVLMIAGAVFGYYVWDLRRKDKEASKLPKKLAYLVSALILASVIGGFFIVGTPAEQRRIKFDEQRVNDLQNIQSQIINYWMRKGVIPQKLEDLNDNISGFLVPTDPETKESYDYNIKDALNFELCAIFQTSSKDSRAKSSRAPFFDSFQQNWDHEKGEKCFERTIDPEIYKTDSQLKGIIPIPVD